jgi:hypothetical protein
MSAKAKSEGFKVAKDACSNRIGVGNVYSDFIFFGCWNNINCENEEYIYRDIVLDYIRDNENDIQQLYIAGDNWYQNVVKIKDRDFKVYLTDILTTGYDKIYAMNKEVYIAVGNHDEDKSGDAKSGDANSGDANSGDTKNTLIARLLKKDCNLNTQKYYLKLIKDRALRENTEPPTLELLYLLAMKNELTDNYMCENGVYIYTDNIGVRYNKGNIVIIINTNRLYTEGLKYIRSIQAVIRRVLLNVELYRGNEQIFVMGHIPMFSFKKDVIKPEKIDDEIILGLFNLFAKNNIIYICADTHNFSIMKIQLGDKVVIQITAGTGGADPDVLTREYTNTANECYVNTVKHKFHIRAFALNPYGYVSIRRATGYNYKVCYKQIIKEGVVGMSGMQSKQSKQSVKEYTYKISSSDSAFESETQHNYNLKIDTYSKAAICQRPPKYITTLKPTIMCYKKEKKEKNKTLTTNKSKVKVI